MDMLGASPLQIIGGVLLFCAIVGLLCVRGWKQGSRTDARENDIERRTRLNDVELRKKIDAEHARLAKLRDAYHRGIGA